jgi:hypothetical protein
MWKFGTEAAQFPEREYINRIFLCSVVLFWEWGNLIAKRQKKSLDVCHVYLLYRDAKGRFVLAFSGSGVTGWPKGRKDPWVSRIFMFYTKWPRADFVLAFLGVG